MDTDSQTFFDRQREQYFPPERNYLKAHLTLFHQLPDEQATFDYLGTLRPEVFEMKVSGLRHLGAGVAYKIASSELLKLKLQLSEHFKDRLIAQDKQPFQPHITIQNKVMPETSKRLLALLAKTFEPFEVKATGLDLWTYLGGPWEHRYTFPFLK